MAIQFRSFISRRHGLGSDKPVCGLFMELIRTNGRVLGDFGCLFKMLSLRLFA